MTRLIIKIILQLIITSLILVLFVMDTINNNPPENYIILLWLVISLTQLDKCIKDEED